MTHDIWASQKIRKKRVKFWTILARDIIVLIEFVYIINRVPKSRYNSHVKLTQMRSESRVELAIQRKMRQVRNEKLGILPHYL